MKQFYEILKSKQFVILAAIQLALLAVPICRLGIVLL